MKLTQAMIIQAYKSYNKLMNYSKNKPNLYTGDYYKTRVLNEFSKNKNFDLEKKLGSLLGALIYNAKTGKDAIYQSDITLDNLKIDNKDEPFLSEKQKEYLLNNIDLDFGDITEIYSIDENGTPDYSRHADKKVVTHAELDNEYKYKEGFYLDEVLDKINEASINHYKNQFNDKMEAGYEAFDDRQKLDIRYAHEDLTYGEELKTYVNGNINNYKKARQQRINELKVELFDRVNHYIGAKKAITEKGMGRYFNPFNWGKTYRENQALTRLENELKNEYGFTDAEIKFLNDKITDPNKKFTLGGATYVVPGTSRVEAQSIRVNKKDPKNIRMAEIESKGTYFGESETKEVFPPLNEPKKEKTVHQEEVKNMEIINFQDVKRIDANIVDEIEKDKKLFNTDRIAFYNKESDFIKNISIGKQFEDLRGMYEILNDPSQKPKGWQLIKRAKWSKLKATAKKFEDSLFYNGFKKSYINAMKNGQDISSNISSKKNILSVPDILLKVREDCKISLNPSVLLEPTEPEAKDYIDNMAKLYNDVESKYNSFEGFNEESTMNRGRLKDSLEQIKDAIKNNVSFDNNKEFNQIFNAALNNDKNKITYAKISVADAVEKEPISMQILENPEELINLNNNREKEEEPLKIDIN